MHYFLYTLLLMVSTSSLLFAQDDYSPQFYDTKEEDPTYIEYKRERDLIHHIIDSIVQETGASSTEDPSKFMELMSLIRNGKDSLFHVDVEDPDIIKILSDQKISQDTLSTLMSRSVDNHYHYNRLQMLYGYQKLYDQGKNTLSGNKDYKHEVKRMKIKDGDHILEIGAGHVGFAKWAMKKTKNLEYTLNEIDSFYTRIMAYALRKDQNIKELTEKRKHTLRVSLGTDTSTGVESQKFDKIILRNTLHHFSNPEAMLSAIKQSMRAESVLIIREDYIGYGKARCPDRITVDAMLSLLDSAGFDLVAQTKKWASFKNSLYHIHFYKVRGV